MLNEGLLGEGVVHIVGCGVKTGPLAGSERVVNTKKEGLTGSVEAAKKWDRKQGKVGE